MVENFKMIISFIQYASHGKILSERFVLLICNLKHIVRLSGTIPFL